MSEEIHARPSTMRVVIALVLLLLTFGVAVVVLGPYAVAAFRAEPLPETSSSQATPLSGKVATETPSPPPSGPATITIAAVGDMIFDRQVAVLIASEGGTAPLAEVAPRLAAADIAVGNLESPLSDRGSRADKDYTFRGDPAGIQGLAAASFSFLSLANNHALDYGPDALEDTILLLDAAGIGHAGAGPDRATAMTPAVRTVRGASVAFLSFSHVLPPGFVAGETRPGIAQGRGNMDAVLAAVSAAKETHDYVLVSFHWGVEYEDHATAQQIEHAHLTVDAGADMILSHHPHVIQALEMYSGGLIAYSSGDFVFDHYSRKTGEAFILEARLGPHGIDDVSVIPVYLDRYGRPEYVTGDEAWVILDRLARISAVRGCTIDIDGDIGRVVLE